MKISSSLEDYIEVISEIIEENGHAHTKDIADRLGVKMPSATKALQNLSEKKLIVYQSHTPVELTPQGAAIGAVIRRRHRSLKKFFVDVIRLDEDHANRVACEIEHVIGEKTTSRLAYLAETIADDPSCDELRRIIAENMPKIGLDDNSIPIALAELEIGESAVIDYTTDKLAGIRKFADLGLVRGTLLTMEGHAPFGDLLRIRVMGSSLSLRKKEAKHIMVKKTFSPNN